VADIRRELGFRTLFNLLGPLANPARARHQVMGVYEARWVPVIGRVLSALGAEHALVVHGEGLDEIAVTGRTRISEARRGAVRDFELTPEELGLGRWSVEELAGGDASTNARILRDVLGGQKGAPRDAVIANASAALVVAGVAGDFANGARLAAQSIDRGAGARKLDDLIRLTSRTA
jgi:anthranilate phosphoribosyltransferase